jgi:hypothetical protein
VTLVHFTGRAAAQFQTGTVAVPVMTRSKAHDLSGCAKLGTRRRIKAE